MFEVSLIAAFFGGFLSFLAPCGAIILPSFLLYSFKERKNLLKASFIFWMGFLLIFIPLGMGISFLIRPLIVYRQEFIWTAGLILIFLGILSFFGKGLSVPSLGFIKLKRGGRDVISLLFLGITFSFALIGCFAPVLGSIITLASVTPTSIHAFLLLFVYSIGLIFPLFILAFFADKYNFAQSKIIQGKIFKVRFGNKKLKIHSTNLVTAIIFIGMGIFFIMSKGTLYLTQLIQKSGLMDFYLEYSQRILLLDKRNDIILVLLLVFIMLVLIIKKIKKQ